MTHIRRTGLSLLVTLTILAATLHAEETTAPTVVVVVGIGGAPDYETQFSQWADQWQQHAKNRKAIYHEVGRDKQPEMSDRDQLQAILKTETKKTSAPLWLIMIGHGTFFRDVAKFNLRGNDVSATELAEWLGPQTRPLVIINCASSSGPFINRLSGPHRILVTSTKSGAEQNFARFGKFLSQAIGDTGADLDHDDEVSLLEAFLSASGRVTQFYQQENRLPTEQALLDDNADQTGTPASFFRGVRAQAAAKEGKSIDGDIARRVHLMQNPNLPAWTAEQQTRRDQIETKIDMLRKQKDQLDNETYYAQLETQLVQLAHLYAEVDGTAADASTPPSQPR
ncbi:MAG TPA: hypothetical protein DCY79_05775 [Planctomycetaceae bacterium]|nr:hypothetical protein [Blastopirellula sp.]MAR08781.1 hypothetical protein [Blastopirellula sp.]HAY79299.1 hypothetical protein [Planctomycetaceae bacterium]